jgi:gas vesicle protein
VPIFEIFKRKGDGMKFFWGITIGSIISFAAVVLLMNRKRDRNRDPDADTHITQGMPQ